MQRSAVYEIRGVFKVVWHEMRCIPDVYLNSVLIDDLGYARDVVEYVFGGPWNY